MESSKSVKFSSAPDTKYERVQTQIQDVAATAAKSTVLRRRSSTVLPEHSNTSHPIIEDDFRQEDENDNGNDNLDSGGSSTGFREYASVLYRHPDYRAYLGSHLCQNLGDHFVRIANVLVVEEFASGSGSALAHATLARLLPNAVFALLGGILADRLDRRRLMITTDCVSGTVVLGYLLAIQYESLPLIYGVTILRSALSATYYPSASGILPDLVRGDSESNRRDLQLAVTLNSWAWGGSVIIGGLFAGKIASLLGLKACYLIDCGTYCISALLISWGVKPDYKRTNITEESRGESKTRVIGDENIDDNYSFRDERSEDAKQIDNHSSPFRYLIACGFGWMVFVKPSASLVWGIEDIVGAQFATVFDDDGTEDTVLSSIHMGLLFSTIGLGCSIGPMILNTISDARKPYTLQRASLVGLFVLGLGWFVISFVKTFPQFLWGSFLRTMGSGAAWVYSTLVLQALCDSTFLGRVLAMEHTLTTLFEATTSFVAGSLSSSNGLTENQLALLGACIGLVVVIIWAIYYSLSLGAAHPRFNGINIISTYEMVGERIESKVEVGVKHVENSDQLQTSGVLV